MIKFLFTLLFLYFAFRVAKTILFGPAKPPFQPPFQPPFDRTGNPINKPSSNRLDQIEDAEFTEIDPK